MGFFDLFKKKEVIDKPEMSYLYTFTNNEAEYHYMRNQFIKLLEAFK